MSTDLELFWQSRSPENVPQNVVTSSFKEILQLDMDFTPSDADLMGAADFLGEEYKDLFGGSHHVTSHETPSSPAPRPVLAQATDGVKPTQLTIEDLFSIGTSTSTKSPAPSPSPSPIQEEEEEQEEQEGLSISLSYSDDAEEEEEEEETEDPPPPVEGRPHRKARKRAEKNIKTLNKVTSHIEKLYAEGKLKKIMEKEKAKKHKAPIKNGKKRKVYSESLDSEESWSSEDDEEKIREEMKGFIEDDEDVSNADPDADFEGGDSDDDDDDEVSDDDSADNDSDSDDDSIDPEEVASVAKDDRLEDEPIARTEKKQKSAPAPNALFVVNQPKYEDTALGRVQELVTRTYPSLLFVSAEDAIVRCQNSSKSDVSSMVNALKQFGVHYESISRFNASATALALLHLDPSFSAHTTRIWNHYMAPFFDAPGQHVPPDKTARKFMETILGTLQPMSKLSEKLSAMCAYATRKNAAGIKSPYLWLVSRLAAATQIVLAHHTTVAAALDRKLTCALSGIPLRTGEHVDIYRLTCDAERLGLKPRPGGRAVYTVAVRAQFNCTVTPSIFQGVACNHDDVTPVIAPTLDEEEEEETEETKKARRKEERRRQREENEKKRAKKAEKARLRQEAAAEEEARKAAAAAAAAEAKKAKKAEKARLRQEAAAKEKEEEEAKKAEKKRKRQAEEEKANKKRKHEESVASPVKEKRPREEHSPPAEEPPAKKPRSSAPILPVATGEEVQLVDDGNQQYFARDDQFLAILRDLYGRLANKTVKTTSGDHSLADLALAKPIEGLAQVNELARELVVSGKREDVNAQLLNLGGLLNVLFHEGTATAVLPLPEPASPTERDEFDIMSLMEEALYDQEDESLMPVITPRSVFEDVNTTLAGLLVKLMLSTRAMHAKDPAKFNERCPLYEKLMAFHAEATSTTAIGDYVDYLRRYMEAVGDLSMPFLLIVFHRLFPASPLV